MGATNGLMKTHEEERNSVGRRAKEVCVWNEDYFDGEVNVFKDISDYMELMNQISFVPKESFLEANLGASNRSLFLNCNPWDAIHL